MLDIKRTFVDKGSYFERMKEKECYKLYIQLIEQGNYNNWYSYCEGKKISMRDLCKLIGLAQLYSQLYQPLCIDTHEINHMEPNIEVTRIYSGIKVIGSHFARSAMIKRL